VDTSSLLEKGPVALTYVVSQNVHPVSHDIVKWCVFLFYKNKLIECECLILIPRNVETVHVYISRIIKAVQVYTRTMFLPICENVGIGTKSWLLHMFG